MHGIAHLEILSRRILFGETGFLDKIDVWLGAAVANRRFVRVHLHDCVVHAHPGESGENMLDRMHAHAAFADCCCALDRLQVLDLRVDYRLVGQIFAFEFDAVIDRRGLQF